VTLFVLDECDDELSTAAARFLTSGSGTKKAAAASFSTNALHRPPAVFSPWLAAGVTQDRVKKLKVGETAADIPKEGTMHVALRPSSIHSVASKHLLLLLVPLIYIASFHHYKSGFGLDRKAALLMKLILFF
jgi:hypothetical protein